jgi:hypothetical protein
MTLLKYCNKPTLNIYQSLIFHNNNHISILFDGIYAIYAVQTCRLHNHKNQYNLLNFNKMYEGLLKGAVSLVGLLVQHNESVL